MHWGLNYISNARDTKNFSAFHNLLRCLVMIGAMALWNKLTNCTTFTIH